MSIKNNWQIKKLDDACNVKYGTRVVNKQDGGSVFPVYGGGGATFFVDEYNRENCMVVARFAMSERCTRFIKGKFFLNDSGLTVLPKSTKEILQEFLDYQLILLNDHIYSLARGSAQKNLDMPAFRKVGISYPESLAEQKRIVGILDEVFEKIVKAKENTEKNLQNSKELFESYLQNVFTNPSGCWGEKTFDELVESNVIGLVRNTREQKPDYQYKYVKMNNITRDNQFDLTKYVRVNANKLETEKFNLQVGDFLFNTRNSHELVGKTCVFRGDDESDLLYNNNIMRVRFKSHINSYFINYEFSSKQIIKKLGHLKSGTTNVSAIYYKDLKNLKLLIPALSEQKSIVAKLDALSEQTKKLEAIYKQKLADLDELKKSVLKRAFEGKLE